ncbi:myosin-binding protein 7 isoform X1 [Iris pallida]|uniref:Myosin-binding protein 7 isoform X1 n=1 Tax=Iris pallida TaxID=29817 RepID=A0AAX6GAM6_IRIPA|nr:myosin-binding protein 7 isoform X1 [Iris pallida]
MDPDTASGCTCSCSTWQRSVKRKLPETSAGSGDGGTGGGVAARVDVEYEVSALREALSRQQQTIQELCAELEQEQNAASSAASETMSMILRLQREKAEVQMDSRQFRRFAEERMAHDQRELAEFDEVLFRRDQAIRSLSCEIRAYRHRLNSYGIEDDLAIDVATPEPNIISPVPMALEFNLPEYDYPPLRCTLRHGEYEDNDNMDLDKYTPPTVLDKIQNLESRVYELETAPGDEGLDTYFDRKDNANALDEVDEHDEGDNGSTRVHTVDMVHGMPIAGVSGEDEEEESCDKVEVDRNDMGSDGDINKLYKRLQALEADRESMRQSIISMRTEKAQLVLLKEIAQQLCKEVVPERRVVRKPSLLMTFSIIAVFKLVMSFIFWRKKASQSKYSFGLSKNNAGLLLLLDKSSRVNQWRLLKSSQR